MSTKLYVGNIAFGTTGADLEQLFGQFGTVTSAQVVNDRETGRSRGDDRPIPSKMDEDIRERLRSLGYIR